ncbi:MAG: phytanoyl-CoA dioxygenase family protein [Pseudomonadota bacterium]
MLKRTHGYLTSMAADTAPREAVELESEGCTIIEQVFLPAELDRLRAEIDEVFDTLPPDSRAKSRRTVEADAEFRYEMLNRSAASQTAIGNPRILEVIEPLLGDDCHVIANTAWRNAPKPDDPAQPWHIDAGPHVPLPEGVSWPEDIPHPVFAIGAHLFLKDCIEQDGPTGVIPGSHKSGRFPPHEDIMNPNLTFAGRTPRLLTARAGDVTLFVSDVWHRRMPTGANDQGRYFLQVHYGRRDIAQRLQTTGQANQVSAAAIERADSRRSRTLIGLHAPFFYDG